jgi:hypothetical protein
MSTTVGFDHLEVDILNQRAKGPDGKDLGSAKVINGKILWTMQAS